jgi:hypothetical protein
MTKTKTRQISKRLVQSTTFLLDELLALLEVGFKKAPWGKIVNGSS